MRSIKYLLGFWTAVLVYGLCSFFSGATGFSAYRHLEDERLKQQKNMEALRVINKELETAKNALLYDKDTLTTYAKELGYGRPNERFIRIVGLGDIKKQRTNPGQTVIAGEADFVSDNILKIISLCAGLTVFICFAIFDLLRAVQEKNDDF
ncbi:MAG: septum formation initiator family protein [Treponema sp.]|jgi:cell division protein FtsB|nr:septum formation initiator family protein [Treponema sp.]